MPPAKGGGMEDIMADLERRITGTNNHKVLLKPAICGIDLGDGSERAEYVNQDYILHT